MQNILNTLIAQTDWAILVMRLALGVIFIAHGWNKLKDFSGTIEWFRKYNFKPASAWAFVATATQFFGGIFILLGLFTQITCLVLAVEMIIATLFNLKRKSEFFEVLELDILLLAALLLLATLGSGPLSLS